MMLTVDGNNSKDTIKMLWWRKDVLLELSIDYGVSILFINYYMFLHYMTDNEAHSLQQALFSFLQVIVYLLNLTLSNCRLIVDF